MKKVLFISYYFPPMGLGGIQRSAKFVKYLPEFGWEPTVLTVKDVLYHAYDPTLLKELPKTRIIRTGSFDPLRIAWKISGHSKKNIQYKNHGDHPSLYHFINRYLFTWIFIPDVKIFWIPHALKEANRILSEYPIDLVFTTSPPHSVHFIGLFLKTKYHIPWIADFRDNWKTELFERGPTVLHRKLDRRMANFVVSRADKIISATQPITGDLMQLTQRDEIDFFTIPNGFDRVQFDATKLDITDSNQWTLTHCGSLYAQRNPEQFLCSVSMAIDARPDMRQKIRIRFVGNVYEINLMKMVEKYNLKDIVHVAGYVSHQENIQYLMASDCLLLLIAKDESKGVATGKIYEYIASGKPILAVVPEGEAEKLVIKHARGVVIPPDDVDGMKVQLIRAFDLWKRRDLKITVPRWKGIEQYSRRNQTKVLADIFDRCVESK